MFNLNSPKFKRALLIAIPVLITLSLILLVVINSKKSLNENVLGVNTNNNVSPTVIGPTSLVNSEMYDVAGTVTNVSVTTTATLTPTDANSQGQTINPTIKTNTPTVTPTPLVSRRTEKFTVAKYGFALEATSKEILDGITFKMIFKDGTESNIYKVNVDEQDTDKEGNPVGTFKSQLYLFTQGISQIDFYYSSTTEKVFNISTLDFETVSKLKSFNTASTTTDGDSEYKKNFLKAAGLNIVTRAEWGGPEENIFEPGWTPGYYAVNRIVIHHTDTDIDLANPANTVKAIWRYHTYNNDWGDIGYNYLIDQNGTIYEGRAGTNGVKSNHAPPNEGSIGIAMLGTYTNQLPTQAALDTLTKLVSYLSVVDNIPLTYKTSFEINAPAGIYPHRAIVATSCPGNALALILPNIVSAASNMTSQFSSLKDLNNKITDEIVNNKIVASSESAEVIINTADLTDGLKTKLNDLSPRLVKKLKIDDTIVYRVKKELLEQFLAELSIVAPEAKPQPNYQYQSTGWVEDTLSSPDRSIPDDFDIVSHWNLNKIKAPEGWNALYNSPAGVHTGTDNVIVAVLDTGVAYQNYSFVDSGTNTDNDYYSIYAADLGTFIDLPYFTGTSVAPETDNVVDMGLERNFYISPEFNASTFVNGYDTGMKYICDWRAADGTKPCNATELEKINHANDDEGHGTFVTSIIAATTGIAPGSTKTDNIIGIASGVKIMPIKINFPNDQSMGNYQNQINTLTLSMGINKAIQGNANIINMSIAKSCGATCTGFSDPLVENAINDAYNNHNILLIASAGNLGTSGILFPAILPNVLSVGATNTTDTRANYSNYGADLDMVAPVGNSTGGPTIKSSSFTCITTNECEFERNLNQFPNRLSGLNGTGTSFSAPQVAAAAALIKSNKSELTNSEIKDRLIYYATDLGTPGWDEQTGYGNLNIYNSLTNEVIPNISSILPISGQSNGGTSVTLTGSGFQVGMKVFFGSTEATSIEFINENQVVVISPRGAEGDVIISSINPNKNASVSNPTYKYTEFNYNGFNISKIASTLEWDSTKMSNSITGDFNSDGFQDIAVMYNYGSPNMGIWVFLNDGNNNFNPQRWYHTTGWDMTKSGKIVAGDFNRDGKTDIATMYDYGSSSIGIWVFVNTGNSFYWQKYLQTAGWDVTKSPELISGDFNRDGITDLATMYNYGNNTVGVWAFINTGSSFYFHKIIVTAGWDATKSPYLVAGDFNRDGNTDIATMYDYGSSSIKMWVFQITNGVLSALTPYISINGGWDASRSSGLIAGDYNRDGNLDIATTYNYGSNQMGILTFFNSGYRTFGLTRFYFTGGWDASRSPYLMSADFNRDGNTDFSLIYNYGNPEIGVWVFTSNSSYINNLISYFRYTGWDASKSPNIVTGDYNGDGLQDYATMYNYGGSTMGLWVFLNNGFDSFNPQRWFYNNGWVASSSPYLVAGDFTNDGRSDLATMYNYGNATIAMWVFPSTGRSFTWQKYFQTTGWDATKSGNLITGDFNSDGRLDIGAMYNYGGNNMGIWAFLNLNSRFTWRKYVQIGGWDASKSKNLVAGDFNKDGKTDFASIYDYGNHTGGLWIFQNDNNAVSGMSKWMDNPNWEESDSIQLITGDFNKDGRIDIASLYIDDIESKVYILKNDSNGVVQKQLWFSDTTLNRSNIKSITPMVLVGNNSKTDILLEYQNSNTLMETYRFRNIL